MCPYHGAEFVPAVTHTTEPSVLLSSSKPAWKSRHLTAAMAEKGVKRKYCGHCHEFLSIRTYRRHDNLFFEKGKRVWLQEESFRENTSYNIEDASASFVRQRMNQWMGKTKTLAIVIPKEVMLPLFRDMQSSIGQRDIFITRGIIIAIVCRMIEFTMDPSRLYWEIYRA